MKTNKPIVPSKILLALAVSLSASISALLQNEVLASEYDQGLKLYQAKNYAAALPLLEKAANAKTNAWQAQYLLGNTCLALGKMDEAKAAYQRCLATCNDKSIQDHAKGGIATVDAYKQAQAQAQTLRKPTATSGSSSSSSSSAKASDDDDEEVAEKKIDKNAKIRQELLAKAREEANKIRREAEEQIKHEKENSNEVFKYSDGSRGLDISDEREQQIRKEAEERAKRVMYEAEQRAKGYRSN